MKPKLCGLCITNQELKDSHLMPSSLYKTIRKSFPDNGNKLVFSSINDQSSFYTDFQVKKYFLCGDCEHKLNIHGENRILQEYYRGENSFKLLDKMKVAHSLDPSNKEKLINPNSNPDFYPNDYLYFGLSILWRASATQWDSRIDHYYNALGYKYQEQIRKYLCGEVDCPDNMNLLVYVANDDDGMLPPIIFPTVTKKFGYHYHEFTIPGIKFSFEIGAKLSESKKMFEVLNTKILFLEYTFKNSKGFELLHDSVKNKIIPRGHLANDLNKLKGL